jgi:hypothetical protein
MVPDRGPFQRTIFPAATARHGELDGTTTGEASRRPAYVLRAGGLHHKGPSKLDALRGLFNGHAWLPPGTEPSG